MPERLLTILMADDDQEDCLLVGDALKATGRPYEFRSVHDGEELTDYLFGHGRYAGDGRRALPDLILLDLKMPRKTGLEALEQIKTDPHLRRIPVIAWTTSAASGDIAAAYDLGVNSYLTKPVTFRRLIDIMDVLTRYWFETVQPPWK